MKCVHCTLAIKNYVFFLFFKQKMCRHFNIFLTWSVSVLLACLLRMKKDGKNYYFATSPIRLISFERLENWKCILFRICLEKCSIFTDFLFFISNNLESSINEVWVWSSAILLIRIFLHEAKQSRAAWKFSFSFHYQRGDAMLSELHW